MCNLSKKQLSLGRDLLNNGFKVIQNRSSETMRFTKKNLTIILIPKVC